MRSRRGGSGPGPGASARVSRRHFPKSLAHHWSRKGSETLASTSARKSAAARMRSPSRMVYCSSASLRPLASWRLLTVCSRMDCILGPHWSHRPLQTRTTESAVRSRSVKMRASSRLIPGAPRSSARSISRTLSMRDSGTCSSSPPTRSAWGSTTMMASASLPAAFSRILWATMLCIRVDLPMRGAGHVEVMSAQ